ncbi:MAG: glycine cleavage system protein GcvH [Thermoprotei archaeon]
MAILNGCELPENLLYYLEGNQMTWIRIEGDVATVGLTDPAQTRAGKILHVRMRSPGTQREKNKPLATIESGKWAGPVMSPLTGVVEKINEKLDASPSLINEDPYGEGWISQIKFSNQGELASLLKGEEAIRRYQEVLTKENIRCIRCQK